MFMFKGLSRLSWVNKLSYQLLLTFFKMPTIVILFLKIHLKINYFNLTNQNDHLITMDMLKSTCLKLRLFKCGLFY
jgi:hypothetical protein